MGGRPCIILCKERFLSAGRKHKFTLLCGVKYLRGALTVYVIKVDGRSIVRGCGRGVRSVPQSVPGRGEMLHENCK